MSFSAYDRFDPATNLHVDVQDDHYTVVREIGAAGSVLLKNEGGALPLKICADGIRSIVLVGPCLVSCCCRGYH